MIRVNLLPEKKKIQLPIGIIIEIIVLGILAYGVLWFFYDKPEPMFGIDTKQQFEPIISSIKKEINQLNAEIKKLEKETGAKQEEQRQQLEIKRREVEMLKQLTGMGILPWSSIFVEFVRIINESQVWVTSFTTQGTNKITLRGVAVNDMTEVSQFMNKLEKSRDNIFSQVILSNSSKDKMYDKDIVNFSLTMNVKKNVGYDDGGY